MAHVTPQPSCFYFQPPPESLSKGLASCALSRFTKRENGLGKDWELGRGDSREKVIGCSGSFLK